MDSSTFAANLGGAAASSLIGGLFSLGAERLRFDHESKLMEKQNQYNIDMWKLNNEYNSPQAQMQRLKDAGLNPNLIYGQGTTGNSSSPPSQGVPSPQNYSKAAEQLSKAFNIENLRTLIANRKEAEAAADNAQTNATRNKRMLFSEEVLGNKYDFDYKTGRFVLRPADSAGHVSVVHPSAWYTNSRLADSWRKSSFVPLRNEYQTYMNNIARYQSRFAPVTYWVDTAGKGIKSVGEITSWFNPSRYLMPLSDKTRGFITPTGKVLTY